MIRRTATLAVVLAAAAAPAANAMDALKVEASAVGVSDGGGITYVLECAAAYPTALRMRVSCSVAGGGAFATCDAPACVSGPTLISSLAGSHRLCVSATYLSTIGTMRSWGDCTPVDPATHSAYIVY